MKVPRWALAFYREHLSLVVAISLVPAVHRFVFVLWGWDFLSVVLEGLVGGVRLLLISVIIWIAIYRDDELASVSDETRQRRVEAFFSAEWPSLIVQFALLAGMIVIFNVVLEHVVVQWIPPGLEDVYLAGLLAAKNLTVIAFTMIWMVGIVRQMLLYTPGSVGKPVQKTARPQFSRMAHFRCTAFRLPYLAATSGNSRPGVQDTRCLFSTAVEIYH